MTLETGKPIAKIFLYNFPFQKDLLPLFSSELIPKIPFSETVSASSATPSWFWSIDDKPSWGTNVFVRIAG